MRTDTARCSFGAVVICERVGSAVCEAARYGCANLAARIIGIGYIQCNAAAVGICTAVCSTGCGDSRAGYGIFPLVSMQSYSANFTGAACLIFVFADFTAAGTFAVFLRPIVLCIIR